MFRPAVVFVFRLVIVFVKRFDTHPYTHSPCISFYLCVCLLEVKTLVALVSRRQVSHFHSNRTYGMLKTATTTLTAKKKKKKKREREREVCVWRERDERERERERERETQDAKVYFDWPVAFTKVILIVANCTLAKCSEEHVNHKK